MGNNINFWTKISIFGQKYQFLGKNRNFGQKSKFCSEIHIFLKIGNFGQESKNLSFVSFHHLLLLLRHFLSEFQSKKAKNSNFKKLRKYLNFGDIYDWLNFDNGIWSKTEILVKNRKLGQKSKFWSKIEITVKNQNYGQKSKFWSKIEITVKNQNYGQKFDTYFYRLIIDFFMDFS